MPEQYAISFANANAFTAYWPSNYKLQMWSFFWSLKAVRFKRYKKWGHIWTISKILTSKNLKKKNLKVNNWMWKLWTYIERFFNFFHGSLSFSRLFFNLQGSQPHSPVCFLLFSERKQKIHSAGQDVEITQLPTIWKKNMKNPEQVFTNSTNENVHKHIHKSRELFTKIVLKDPSKIK